jgi:hypothetical protein
LQEDGSIDIHQNGGGIAMPERSGENEAVHHRHLQCGMGKMIFINAPIKTISPLLSKYR